MKIVISNAIGKPIYEQICTQIKNSIISNQLGEGEMLPSIRNLAKDLKISVITTKRAYEELEKQGYINSVPGKGMFVAPKNITVVREEYLRTIEQHMTEIIELAHQLDLSNEEVIAMYETMKGEIKS